MDRKILAPIIALSLLAGLLGVATPAFAQTPPVALSAAEGAPDGPVAPLTGEVTNLIVTYEDNVSPAAQIDAIEEVVDVPAADITPVAANVVAVKVSPDASIDEINNITNNPNVKYVEEDLPIYPTGLTLDPLVDTWQNWGVRGPNPTPNFPGTPYGSDAISAWGKGFVGSKNTYVAVIDTGIDIDHPDLAANIWVNTKEIPNNGVDDDKNGYVDDYNGWNSAEQTGNIRPDPVGDIHGTAVAGIIGAVGGNNVGIAGINWNVGIVPVKAMVNNQGLTSSMIAAVDYVTALRVKNKLNVVAINASWGGGSYSWALRDAIRYAGDQGVLFVASAGNEGRNNDATVHYPSGYDCSWWYRNWDCVISVAAHNSSGVLSSFSNYGTTNVDISAPGESVYTTSPNSDYRSFSGTSASAPYVTGAVALCSSANTTMPTNKIREAILNTATPNASIGTKVATGGMLNVNALLQACVGVGQDYGAITGIRQTGVNTIRVEGWVSPNGSTSQDSLMVRADDTVATTLRFADMQTNGTKSTFAVDATVNAGLRNICIDTTNRSALDCRDFTVVAGDKPVGAIQSGFKEDGFWTLSGWALDPINTGFASVSLYVDSVLMDSYSASDPAVVFPRGEYSGWDTDRDFRFWWTTTPGSHNACVVATSVDGKRTTQLGCFAHYEFATRNPVGAVDSVRKNSSSQVQVSGWALDPDVNGPVDIYVYIDQGLAMSARTDIQRADVTKAYPGYSSTFGYSIPVSVNASKATQEICVYAVNQGGGTASTRLGCQTITNTTADPIGVVENAQVSAPRMVRVSGWAHDADTRDPLTVHVYVNSKFHSAHTADAARSDIQATYATAGTNHGFNVNLSVGGGVNNVCVYAINAGGGTTNTLLGCRSVTVPTGNPIGNVDSISQFGPGTVRIGGWTLDPDTANPLAVHTYVNGVYRGSTTANTTRADVGRLYPLYGNNHGFSFTVSGLRSGANSVCVYAINAGAGNTNPLLGCRTVNTWAGNPTGNFEGASVSGANITVSGWALDPDTVNPVAIHTYVNGVYRGAATANRTRTDVGRAFPGYGDAHGFSTVVSGSRGSNTVCVFAINAGAGNTNPLLGCRIVNIP